MNITYSEWVCMVLVIEHAKRMRHITLSYVACLALTYSFTLSHKLYDFWRGGFIEHKMRVLIFYTTFV